MVYMKTQESLWTLTDTINSWDDLLMVRFYKGNTPMIQ